MKKYAAYLLSVFLLTNASAMAEVYNPNGKLFVYREYMEKPGNKEIVNRIFRVDNEGKVEVLFCASPGGTEDAASKVLRSPDLMQGRFKIEGEKLYFYTSDEDEYCWPARDIDQTVNPILFFSEQYARQASKAKDEASKEDFQAKADYTRRIYDMKKIEYVYDPKCNCMAVNEKALGILPTTHLYQGTIVEIKEEEKDYYLKQVLTKRQEVYSSYVVPELCYLQEGTSLQIKDNVCKSKISCSIRPFGFNSYFKLECPSVHCADPSKPDLVNCYNGTKKLSPDFEAYGLNN
jgi:hypothetical protein